MKSREILSKLGDAILLLQPFLTFPIFLSVLLGVPPLWLSWLIAVIPLPFRFFITRRLTVRTPFDIPILILTAGVLAGFFVSSDLQLRISFINTYLACLFFYYGLINNAYAKLIYWLSIAGFLFLVLCFLSVWVFAGTIGKYLMFNTWAYNLASFIPLPSGMSINPNVLGGAFAVLVPSLAAIALFRQRSWVRWSAGILAIFFSLILLLSASGGGWIATIVGIFIVLLFYSTKAFWCTFLASLATVGATFPIWHNASWVGAVFNIQSFLCRPERWQSTVVALKHSPLTGFGLGGWWSKVTNYGMMGGPHNTYLQLYSDTGALGLISLVIFILVGVKLFRRILKSDRGSPYYGITLALSVGLISNGIHALVDDNMSIIIPLGNEYLYFVVPLFWLWLALLVVSNQHLQNDITDSQSTIESHTDLEDTVFYI